MKKILALVLALMMVVALFAACNNETNPTDPSTPSTPSTPSQPSDPSDPSDPTDPSTPVAGVMTHAQYLAAAEDEPVEIEAYVQATQSWYNNAIVIYAQDKTYGGYFGYNIPCSEEDAAKLVPGTKINIKGYKTFYKGMPEIAADGAVLTILEGEDTFIANAEVLTDMLGKQELVNRAGALGMFKGLTIAKIEYKNGEPGDDIYVDFTLNGNTYSFCVERYLTGPDTDVYKAFAELQVGDVVNVYGFVYWYDADEDGQSGDGINTHITKIYKVD